MTNKPKVSLILTNWNGSKLLRKNLPTVIKHSPEVCEIIVADDHSTDSSLKYLKLQKAKYPNLKIISHSHNLGFGKNSNHAVSKAVGDFVVLLNNDIRPYPGYISHALKLFTGPSIAAVGFCEVKNENWARIFWSGGYLQHESGVPSRPVHNTAWVSGGGSIFRKDIFLKLGGFDQAYAPFYYEDADLGLRLWLSGYRLLWCSKAKIEHRHEATTSRFPSHFLNYVKERNRLLLTRRIIRNPRLLSENRLAVIGRILFGPNYIKIVMATRKQQKLFPTSVCLKKISDIQLIKIFA